MMGRLRTAYTESSGSVSPRSNRAAGEERSSRSFWSGSVGLGGEHAEQGPPGPLGDGNAKGRGYSDQLKDPSARMGSRLNRPSPNRFAGSMPFGNQVPVQRQVCSGGPVNRTVRPDPSACPLAELLGPGGLSE
jgi:hypothetical protein